MKNKNAPPPPLADLVKQLLKQFGLETITRERAVFQAWDQAIGEPIASHAQPIFIHDGSLVVGVSDSAWIQELQFMKNEIKKKLNRALGPNTIRQVSFKIADIDARPREEISAPAPAGDSPSSPLDPQTVEEARAAVASVPDPQLREQLLRALLASARKTGLDEDD